MDNVRYAIALFLVAFSPGVFLFWFSIHPFIGFWRKVGVPTTMAVHYVFMILFAVPFYLARKAILYVDFGANPILMIAAAILLAVIIYLRFYISKRLPTKSLSGFPEIAPDKYERKLLTEGIYARIRHPRYVQLLLAFLAYALFTNYLAVYVIFFIGLIWVRLVVQIEERELRDTFGEEYERYRKRVPPFLPRLKIRG